MVVAGHWNRLGAGVLLKSLGAGMSIRFSQTMFAEDGAYVSCLAKLRLKVEFVPVRSLKFISTK
jgi:hypothetical protein